MKKNIFIKKRFPTKEYKPEEMPKSGQQKGEIYRPLGKMDVK
jgi:hypothetical protein